jgi:hypothetical protein
MRMTMIGLIYFLGVSRGEVNTYSIWKDKINGGHGFVGLYFTKTYSEGRIHDGWQFHSIQGDHFGVLGEEDAD